MTRFVRSMCGLICALSPMGGVLAAPIDPANPPQGRFLDEWGELYMAGGKVGYVHSTIARDAGLIHTHTTSKIRLGRVDSPVGIRIVQSTTEKLDGIPVAFSSEMDASVMKTSTTGTIEGGRVTIVTSQYGNEQTQTHDFSEGALMTWGATRENLLRGFEPGTKYAIEVYAPEIRLTGPVTMITKIGDWEEFEHDGRRFRGQRATVIMKSPVGSIESDSWIDKNGRPIRTKIPMPGLGDLVMLSTDQKTALADFIPPEIFMKTVIKANKRIDAKSADRITYRIRTTKPEVDLTELPSTDMQTVTKRTADSVELVITRQPHKPVAPGAEARADSRAPQKLQDDQLAEYLEPNLMINTDDPKLVELAKRAAGEKTDRYVLADKLRRFVSDYVTSKTLNIGFATASEVGRTREGDCSEHGVLLAALGRLSGLPSRVAVGVAYVPSFGQQESIFGYHMWTQFYIDGRWIDVDAALRETVCSPTRIAFATSSLKNTGLADLSLPLLSKIGAIDIDILDIE